MGFYESLVAGVVLTKQEFEELEKLRNPDLILKHLFSEKGEEVWLLYVFYRTDVESAHKILSDMGKKNIDWMNIKLNTTTIVYPPQNSYNIPKFGVYHDKL